MKKIIFSIIYKISPRFWDAFFTIRSNFHRALNESEKKYNEALLNIATQIAIILNSDPNKNLELKRKDIIIGIAKFTVLATIFDIILTMSFNSLYQTMIYTGSFYMGVPFFFLLTIGLASLIIMFSPKHKFTVDPKHDALTISRVYYASIVISIVAANMLVVQIFYTLGAVIEYPTIQNLKYVMVNNIYPCLITLSVISMSKHFACTFGAIPKYKVATYFD